MATRFDDWEGDCLKHYGIPGMKWGVRKYQNPDGSLTAAGQRRYGENSGGVSAKKLQRSYNRADQVYANAKGAERLSVQKAFKYGKKFTDRGNKLESKGKDPMKDRKTMRLMDKAKKAQSEAEKHAQEAKEAESLQWRIIGKVAKQGYTMSSKPVKRAAQVGQQAVAQFLFGAPGAIAYVAKNRKALSVGGTKAKISKKGNGSIKIKSAPSSDILSETQKAYARKQARRDTMHGLAAIAGMGARDAVNNIKSDFTGRPYRSSAPEVADERRNSKKKRG